MSTILESGNESLPTEQEIVGSNLAMVFRTFYIAMLFSVTLCCCVYLSEINVKYIKRTLWIFLKKSFLKLEFHL
jgi:hypothetical protein